MATSCISAQSNLDSARYSLPVLASLSVLVGMEQDMLFTLYALFIRELNTIARKYYVFYKTVAKARPKRNKLSYL